MIYSMFIGNEWYQGKTKEFRDVVSPGTGETIGQIPMGNAEDVDKAVEAACLAAPTLEALSVFERAELCVRIADAIENRKEELAKILSMEHGKPYYTEGLGEVEGSILAFREAAEQIKWMNDEIIPMHDKTKRAYTYRKPKGVYAVITPWNFPLALPSIYYLAPGIAAGNSIVWSPATYTSAAASVFMKCFEDANLPKGTVNLVLGKGSVVGDALVVHPKVDAVTFTGSPETGMMIEGRAGIKPTAMELGGNGPTIVYKDADLDLTAEELLGGSFANAGQICTITERVLIDDSIADKLVEKMMAKIGEYILGDPFDKNTTMGPMNNQPTVDKVNQHIKDAVDKGAKIVVGGGVLDDAPTGLYFKPTIIDHVSPDSLINVEETFGPVIPFITLHPI